MNNQNGGITSLMNAFGEMSSRVFSERTAKLSYDYFLNNSKWKFIIPLYLNAEVLTFFEICFFILIYLTIIWDKLICLHFDGV